MSLIRPTSEFTSRREEDESSSLGNPLHLPLGKGEEPTDSPPFQGGVRGGCRSSLSLNEAILASSSSVRDSIPEQHRAHFETLRQEIIDFAKAHDIPRESLTKPDALVEAAKKLSTPDLQRLALLLERFEYLLVHKEPQESTDPLEYVEKYYHLKKQYDSQVDLLKQVGILKEGAITGIDGNTYPIPTLEQITARLFEQRETLSTKHDQGFTKLLLVPFGMSLDALVETFKQFLLSYKQKNPTFDLDTNRPLWAWEEYQGADMGDSPKLVYHPQSFTEKDHGGKTKVQILEEQEDNQYPFPGWTIHFLQPSDPSNPDSPGFAHIPREGKGILQGKETPRPPLEAGQSSNEYLSTIQKAQDDEDSHYHGETGLTPEDWIMAFMIHLTQTGQPIDNFQNGIESISYLTGVFFPSHTVRVPYVYWLRSDRQVSLYYYDSSDQCESVGVRTSVIV